MRSRLPPATQIAPVLATIMFLVYSYAFYRLFWYVPSWLDYLPAQSILSIVAYMASLALFESLSILGLLIVAAAILPAPWLRQRFATQGTLAVWSLAAVALLVHENLQSYLAPFSFLGLVVVLLVTAALLLAAISLISYLVVHRIRRLEAWVSNFSERMTIFLYLYLPFSILGLVVVLVRVAF